MTSRQFNFDARW